MALKVSTGLRNHMLALGSLKDGLDAGFLRIYAGTEPATADAAIAGPTLLCLLSVGGLGTGLTWETPAINGIISKTASEVWQGQILNPGGVATFFRFVSSTDTGGAVPAELRIQGTVGVVGAELNLSSVNLTAGAQQIVNHFNVALPTL